MAWISDWETFASAGVRRGEVQRLGLRQGGVGCVVVIGDCADRIDRTKREFLPGTIRIADFWHTCEHRAEVARKRTATARRPRGKLRRGRDTTRRDTGKWPRSPPCRSCPQRIRNATPRCLRNTAEDDEPTPPPRSRLPIGYGSVEGRKNPVGPGIRGTPDARLAGASLRALRRDRDWALAPPSPSRPATPPLRHSATPPLRRPADPSRSPGAPDSRDSALAS